MFKCFILITIFLNVVYLTCGNETKMMMMMKPWGFSAHSAP